MNIVNFFKRIWSKVWNFRRERSYDDILKKLDKGIRKKRNAQIGLKNEILKKMRNDLRYDANSKFIPPTGKSEFMIRELVERKWGKRMATLNVILNKDMILEIL